MKKALIQLLILPIITLVGAIGTALLPPSSGSGQLPPDKRVVEDSAITLKEAKEIINTAERNSAIVKGMEAGKKAELKTLRPVKKVVIKKAPIVKTVIDTVYRDSVINRNVIIYRPTPVYRTHEIKYMTFSEWRENTGEKSERRYREYLKTLNLIR